MSYHPNMQYNRHRRHRYHEGRICGSKSSGYSVNDRNRHCTSTEESSYSDNLSSSSSMSATGDRKNRKRDQQSSDSPSVGISNGDIIAIVALLSGLSLTGGIGGIGIQVAAASLRLVTMTAYVGATGAAAVGTGYVAIQGGRLVVQQARPGVIMTVRAANKVSRDCRSGALAAGQAVFDAAGAIQSDVVTQVQTTANATSQIRNQVLSGSEALIARLFNLPTQIPNILLRSVAQSQDLHTTLLYDDEAQAQAHAQDGTDPNADMFLIQQLADGTTVVQRVVRNGDLGDALWINSQNTQLPSDQSEENEDGFVDVQVQRNSLLSDDRASVSDNISFETAHESLPTAVEDSDTDFEII